MVMYVIFFILLLPLIALVSIGYRVSFLYFAVRDACYQAAKATTFSGSTGLNAQTAASTAWTKDTATTAWSGLSGTEVIYIVTQPIAGGAESVTSTHLPTTPQPSTSTNVYSIRLIATCSIQPMFPAANGWQGISIPGFTQAMPITLKYQCFVENASGLTQ
jgi:hypothetical protein